jgi:hypothetical protein
LNDVGYTNNYFYHTNKLQNLQPDTKYYYRAVSGTDSSAVLHFRTLPLPGNSPAASGKLRFVILGDNQIKAQPRYDSLMVATRRKLTELYGPDYADSVTMILNLGDQVDVGTLDHYENVHLQKSRYLSGVLPIQTAVGNHETYGTLKLDAYYNHFVLDSMQYKGIYSGTEDYYAFQAGNVVVVYTYTETPGVTGTAGTTQFNWFKKVIDSANVDPTVKWIITIGHRPYQAEQYVGDISPWIRNTVVPYALTSPKFFLHVGAHHHLYSRGQMKDQPAYNIISGGTAWDQYWGMSTEQNFDDVQKTISNWAWQLIEFNTVTDRADVTTYSVGSVYKQLNNRVIDSFHRYLGLALPTKPSIIHNYPDSVQLPYTISGSAFASAAGEQLNSTEFQVAQSASFAVLEKNDYRHFEDIFGAVTGQTPDTSKNQNLGVDISKTTLNAGTLANGKHYIRVRHRDRNMNWSAWSDTDSFKVYNSAIFNPSIALDTIRYAPGDTIRVSYSNAPVGSNTWIGLYFKNQTPSGSSASQTWAYTTANSGVLKFTRPSNATAYSEYYAVMFSNNGYTEITPRSKFYYGPAVSLSTNAASYSNGATVPVAYTNAPNKTKDWIGIYKIGMTPGSAQPALTWGYTNATSGTFTTAALGKGYYFATYLSQDGYFEVGARTYFSVGDTITQLATNKTTYNLGEYIAASWIDGPGNPKDWLGIYANGANPNVDPLLSYTYISGLPNGSRNIPDTAMPQTAGNYFIVLFTNDSYNEVSNRVAFQMVGTPLAMELLHFNGVKQGMTHLLEWEMASEDHASQYRLESSSDGSNFRSLYTTQAQPAARLKYQFKNEKLDIGKTYYRLALTDAGGKTEYSRVVMLDHSGAGEGELKMYPNPISNGQRSIIESPYPIEAVEILDAAGQIIYRTTNTTGSKMSLLHQDLPAGTYFVRIFAQKTFTARLVIR